jgi:hypothetical protein
MGKVKVLGGVVVVASIVGLSWQAHLYPKPPALWQAL